MGQSTILITENLPKDVKELYFSGRFWYASSTTISGFGPHAGNSLAIGCGETHNEAIDEMRDLESRYLPHKERGPTWKDKQKKYAPKEATQHSME